MKRILLFLRRRLLLRVHVARGIVLRPGDSVLVFLPGQLLAAKNTADIRAAFEKNHPGVTLVFGTEEGHVVVLSADPGRRESNVLAEQNTQH